MGSDGSSFLNFEDSHTVSHNGCPIPHSHLQGAGLPFLPILPGFVLARLADDGHPNRCPAMAHCGLSCIFLMIGDAEHLLLYLLAVCVSFGENV